MDSSLPEKEEFALKASRRERFNNSLSTNRYLELKDARERLRQQLIAQGVISDPAKRTSLADAKPLVGTCTSMCPDFEREQREYQNNLDKHELIPGTRRADPARAVKTFHRSAAGNEEPLPSDVRTPETLLGTLDYLVNVVIAGNQTLESCHGFVRDRTRSIRQDFTLQNIRDRSTIVAHERIARFHIAAMHILCGNKDFAEHQDMEQLRKVLKTLIELYDDHRRLGVVCPNEAEFYAYYIASHLRDSDAKRVAERLPGRIFTAPIVQQALKLHRLSQTSNEIVSRQQPPNLFAALNLTTQFFRAVSSDDTPLLLACLVEYEFPSIRRAGLKAMNMAFPHQRGREYPAEEFAAMFAFDSENEVVEFCALFNIPVNKGGVMLGAKLDKRLVYTEPDNRPKRTQRNIRAVGFKFQMITPMQAIDADLDPRFLLPRALGPPSQNPSSAGIVKRPPASLDTSYNRSANGTFSQPAESASAGLTEASEATSAFSNNLGTQATSIESPKAAMSAASSQPPGFDQRPANAFASNHTGFLSGLLAPATSSAAPSAKAPVPPVPSAGPFSSFVPLASKSAAAASTAPAQKPIFGSLASMPPLPAEAPELKDGLTKETHVPSLTTSLAGHPHTPLPGSNSSQPVAANIVWNKPRQRISWTSLCDTLFDDLVASLAREVAQPVSAKAKRNKEIADTLTADIADAIVDYTGAFVAYEEAYRSVLFAKADHFQRRAALNSAFARWAMELTVRQQESALHQQHIDDLEEIVDREYTLQEPVSLGTCDPFSTPRKARHQQQAIISPASYRQNYANRTAKHSGSSNVSPISPDAFWESCHIGHDGFEAICRSLGRFGDPPFRLAVDIAGTGNDSVLSSWLWWQIDPDSIARSSSSGGPSRSVEYGKGAQHLVIQEAGDLSSAGVAGEHRGKVILLSPHPVSDDDVRTGLEDSATGTEIAASAGSIASALRSDGATSDECALLLFWCSSSKSGKAGRKFVEKSIRDGCISASLAHLKIVALDIESPKKQLVAGFKWVYSRMSCARQALLVRASKALGPVSASMLQSLRRMHGCVVGLLGQQYSEPNSVLIFNKAVDIANAFVDVLRTHLFGSTSSISVHWYPHMQGTALDRDFFIQCISSTTVDKEGGTRPLLLEADALLCASIDEILASGRPADNQQPTLDAYLRALEFMARHQLDVLQQTTPGDMYAERPAIGAAAEKAIQHSDQLISECSRVSQSEGYTTPAFATPGNKRTSSLAFNSTSSTPTAATSCLATSPTTARSSITAIKRRKPGPSSKLSKLQSAIARASKQLE